MNEFEKREGIMRLGLDSLDVSLYNDEMPITYYTIKEISEKLGITRQRVHQLIDEREIPTKREGRLITVREDHLLMFEDRKDGRPTKKLGRPRKSRGENS